MVLTDKSKCKVIYAIMCNPKQNAFSLSLIRVHRAKGARNYNSRKLFCSKIWPSSFIACSEMVALKQQRIACFFIASFSHCQEKLKSSFKSFSFNKKHVSVR